MVATLRWRVTNLRISGIDKVITTVRASVSGVSRGTSRLSVNVRAQAPPPGGLQEGGKALALSACQQFAQYMVATNKTQATDITNNATKRWNC